MSGSVPLFNIFLHVRRGPSPILAASIEEAVEEAIEFVQRFGTHFSRLPRGRAGCLWMRPSFERGYAIGWHEELSPPPKRPLPFRRPNFGPGLRVYLKMA